MLHTYGQTYEFATWQIQCLALQAMENSFLFYYKLCTAEIVVFVAVSSSHRMRRCWIACQLLTRMGNTDSAAKQQPERTPKLNAIPARLPMPDHAELEQRFTRVLVSSVLLYNCGCWCPLTFIFGRLHVVLWLLYENVAELYANIQQQLSNSDWV